MIIKSDPGVPLKGLANLQSVIEKKLHGDYSNRINRHPQVQEWKGGEYINCDLRYFNLSSLGNFSIVLIDPPWRISGAQRHVQSANMFSNSK